MFRLPTKHKDILRRYKTVLNHLNSSLCFVGRYNLCVSHYNAPCVWLRVPSRATQHGADWAKQALQGRAPCAQIRRYSRGVTAHARGRTYSAGCLGMWLILVMIMLTHQRRHDDVPVTYYWHFTISCLLFTLITLDRYILSQSDLSAVSFLVHHL